MKALNFYENLFFLARQHKFFILFLLVFNGFSLWTINDYPFVDKTIDDMWHLDKAINIVSNGAIHQSFFLDDRMNRDFSTQTNLNDLFHAWSYQLLRPNVFSLRYVGVLVGAMLLCLMYAFSLKFFKNYIYAISSTIMLAFTNEFFWKSHDTRPEIFMALIFFITFTSIFALVFYSNLDQKSYKFFIFFPFISCTAFFQVHPNGIILIPLVFLLLLVFRRQSIYCVKTLLYLLIGVVVFFIYDVLADILFFSVPLQRDQPYLGLEFNAMLNYVPIYQVSSIHDFESFTTSIYHIIGLIVKSFPRFLHRIDRDVLTGYVDYGLICLSLILCIISSVRHKAHKDEKIFMAAWIVLYGTFQKMISHSPNDYSINIMPVVILLLFVSLIDLISEVRTKQWLFSIISIQIILTLLMIFQIKFVNRFFDEYQKINYTLSSVIPERSSILGAPLFFTMLKPKIQPDYRDIYYATGVDWAVQFRMKDNEKYDFLKLFNEKQFEYIIYDDFFEYTIGKIGFTKESFLKGFMQDYEKIYILETNYLTMRGTLKRIEIYKRRNKTNQKNLH